MPAAIEPPVLIVRVALMIAEVAPVGNVKGAEVVKLSNVVTALPPTVADASKTTLLPARFTLVAVVALLVKLPEIIKVFDPEVNLPSPLMVTLLAAIFALPITAVVLGITTSLAAEGADHVPLLLSRQSPEPAVDVIQVPKTSQLPPPVTVAQEIAIACPLANRATERDNAEIVILRGGGS
ncbi:MAG: hypothetical protein RIT27_1775 [Pseudomonadota bacterium]